MNPDGDFGALGLHPDLLTTLGELGYEAATPIQNEAIPHMLAGSDLLGQAATGTGKTAAFALPILSRLTDHDRSQGPAALVLVPTRELCMQVSSAMHRYGRSFDARTLPIYGGAPIGRQISELRRGVDIVVATPGRALDHLKRGTLTLDNVATVVLDEADEMLDMGFAEDLDAILAQAPKERQTVLFSATMPRRILGIAEAHLSDPVRIEIARSVPAEGEGPQIAQTAYIVPRAHKVAALGRILDIESPTATLVFCRTRDEVDQLTETLNGRGYRAEGLHGGMDQAKRDRVMGRLRNGTAELLVATDVAARGLDVEHLTHVVNFDVPSAPESYVHRIGRVGRGGRAGVAITLADPREQRLLKTIERVTKQKVAIAKIPTSADLRARRLELTRAAVYEACMDDDLDDYRVVLESLTDDFDVVQVALAALKLAHRKDMADTDTTEIPQPEARPERKKWDRDDRGRGRDDRGRGRDDRGRGRDDRGRDDRGRDDRDRKHRDRDERPRKKRDREDYEARYDSSERPDRGDREGEREYRGRDEGGKPGTHKHRGRDRQADVARIYVSAGRDAGVRPQDIVGAIAGETGLAGRDIGAISISDRYSIVEVPNKAAKDVIGALSRTRLKGNRVKARFDRN